MQQNAMFTAFTVSELLRKNERGWDKNIHYAHPDES